MEVSEYLVGSPAFKAGDTGDPRMAGSIPVHLRKTPPSEEIYGGGRESNPPYGDRPYHLL